MIVHNGYIVGMDTPNSLERCHIRLDPDDVISHCHLTHCTIDGLPTLMANILDSCDERPGTLPEGTPRGIIKNSYLERCVVSYSGLVDNIIR
jgi:hypothetical protein